MGIVQERMQEWVAMPSSEGYPDPGIEPRSLALQVDSLPTEPPRKPQTHEILPAKAVYSKSEIGLFYSKFCVDDVHQSSI